MAVSPNLVAMIFLMSSLLFASFSISILCTDKTGLFCFGGKLLLVFIYQVMDWFKTHPVLNSKRKDMFVAKFLNLGLHAVVTGSQVFSRNLTVYSKLVSM